MICHVKTLPLLLLLGLGPRAVIFGHLDFDCGVAWFYGQRVHVDGLCSHAAPAVATQPLAVGNEHELSTRAERPIAFGRNEAHQELVPGLETALGPAIRERVSRTDGLDAPGLLFALV